MRRAVLAGLVVLLGCRNAPADDDAGETSETGDGDGDPGDGDGDGDGDDDGGECDIGPIELEVPTLSGPVVGTHAGGVLRFTNIPYAAAPTGTLRFAPPQPHAPWQQPRDATTFGPKCVQLSVAADDPSTEGSEDCLQLNIWTPGGCIGSRTPVMVFIHGGGNAVGSAVDPLHDAAKLADAQQAVVVTLNYRLGALANLTLPELDAERSDGVSGNLGVLDQIAALEWIHENISNFGGDPTRVLLFGESAGAVNVCSLLGSPLADGLYSSSIIQSGSCAQPDRAALDQLSAEFVINSGCVGPDVLDCLRALPADELVFIAPNGYPDVGGLARGWGPHVDGVVLPQRSLERLAAGHDTSFVIGSNRDETARDSPQALTEAEFTALVTATFAGLAPQVLAAYPVADYPSPSAAWWSLTSDVKFICNARRGAEAARSGGAPTWRYQFSFDDYQALGNTPTYAFHGLELVYLFANFDALGFAYEPSDAELELSLVLQQMWSEFAAIGGFAAPQYELGVDPYLELDVPNSTGAGLRTEQCDFWAQWIP